MKVIQRSLILILFAAGAATTLNAQTVRVYVYAQSADGFVDGTRVQDTVKDIQRAIDKRKGLVLVLNPDQAQVRLEVTASGMFNAGSTTSTRPGIFGGLTSTTTAQTLPGIEATIHVSGSDYTKPISYISQMFWKDLASRLVDQ